MPSERILLGPGPSLLPPEVSAALGQPQVGHLDPELLPILDETVVLLRQVFQTNNELTLPISATGTGGMEAALVHLAAPDETLVVCTAGYFADRIAEIGERVGARVVRVEAPWGQAVDPADLRRTLAGTGRRATCVAAVQVETSTGVLQPLRELIDVAHAHGARVLVDAVASLGGVELPVDAWGIDVCYSGSQKCLSAPPGMAPITAHDRTRGRRPATFYLDLEALWKYWSPAHTYHHTVPVSLVYAMHQALRLIAAESLEARVARHWRNARGLWAGLQAMGLDLLVDDSSRSPTVTTVRIPEGIDDARVRGRLLREYNVEIAGGLGPLRGRIWRIGLMGHSSQPRWVVLLLGALESVLASEGFKVRRDAAAAAAAELH